MDNDDLVFRINDISSGPKKCVPTNHVMSHVTERSGMTSRDDNEQGQSRDHNVKFH